jgi:hypothetical protein
VTVIARPQQAWPPRRIIVEVGLGADPHAEDAVARVDQLLTLRNQLLEDIRAAHLRGVAVQLAGDLIGYPMLTVNAVKDLYHVSYQAANSAVGKMTELGMLRQRTEGRYARIFSCDTVLTLLESPT